MLWKHEPYPRFFEKSITLAGDREDGRPTNFSVNKMWRHITRGQTAFKSRGYLALCSSFA
jgi:hypothetical protein